MVKVKAFILFLLCGTYNFTEIEHLPMHLQSDFESCFRHSSYFRPLLNQDNKKKKKTSSLFEEAWLTNYVPWKGLMPREEIELSEHLFLSLVGSASSIHSSKIWSCSLFLFLLSFFLFSFFFKSWVTFWNRKWAYYAKTKDKKKRLGGIKKKNLERRTQGHLCECSYKIKIPFQKNKIIVVEPILWTVIQ